MNIENLFCGVVLVVDDNVNNVESGDSIVQIVEELEHKHVLLSKYEEVPDVNICHCRNLSFVLLDWELVQVVDANGIPICGANEALRTAHEDLTEFISKLLESCYVPIFIFSNENPMDIKRSLKDKGIDVDDVANPIFVKSKSEIVTEEGVTLFPTISDWLDGIPAIYVLKVWEQSLTQSMTSVFQALAPTKAWPKILWETAEVDGADPSSEIADVLSKNIFSCMQPVNFEKDQINKVGANEISQNELQRVLKAQRFLERNDLTESLPGDFYIIDGHCKVNVRPACDTTNREGDNCVVYLLGCSCLKYKEVKELYNQKNGNFVEPSDGAIIGPLYKNRYYKIRFKDIVTIKYADVREQKIGRILPPFINHVTEKYGLYIQRQAMPRLPHHAVLKPEDIAQ